ncbi:FMN-linked oxidoreductase [Pluteus cervinus]|uniref:FMN-linked oxidoreductase n=1 Tax=Pluteus cervinus TaxID=181527 RepID=A0ACD3BC40_9AGAR|nr:FMN-linked oxidoreductase [Pluteus cervinus]
MVYVSGTAPIKSEYLLSNSKPEPIPDDDAAEGTTSSSTPRDSRDDPRDSRSSGGKKFLTKEQKKAQRGANKARKFGKVRDEFDLCWRIANGSVCEFGADECRFNHDISGYLRAKPKDLKLPSTQEVLDAFVAQTSSLAADPTAGQQQTNEPDTATSTEAVGNLYPNVDFSTTCLIYAEAGECRYGFKCRFLGGHTRIEEDGSLKMKEVDEERKARAVTDANEMNFVSAEVQKALKTRKYPSPVTDEYLKELQSQDGGRKKGDAPAPMVDPDVIAEPEQEDVMVQDLVEKRTGNSSTGGDVDSPDLQVRPAEKKRLDWTGKTYLAPLTTVGNLPFRRLCVKYGADITCGEMGLATSFLSGSKEEWSLVRRHPSEQIFGVQLAGNKPANLVPTAEVIAKECAGGVDFVDLNCGCPIDLVFKAGSGSALLDAAGKLGKILVGMNKALGDIPLTVKLRTGVKDGKNMAHKLMPRVAAEWNVSCLTLHGRTREQRYTKLADWNYIKECVDAVRAREAEEDLTPIPIFGGGDCFSSQDHWEKIEATGVDGVMVGRGALIKPWIFTEIKDRREWDISSRERLDLIRTYAENAISHWGTDTIGVNTARRYLCESLSFQYRYVPIGLLEQLPGHINDRAPAFRGRDELETLLASGNSQDWVKISEMFLGPAPDGWSFTPKHKSNSYESQG